VDLILSLSRAVSAELLKLRRTLAFRVIFVLPFLVALLQFFIVLRMKKFPATFNLWQTLPTNSLQVWAVFMMPLLIALELPYLMESSTTTNNGSISLPCRFTSRGVFRKVDSCPGLIFLSTFFLSFLTVIVGLLSIRLRPELATSGAAPYGLIAKTTAMVWLASGMIIAIHTWISMRWSGFPIPLGAGIGGTFFALFAASASLGKYYPWLLPMNIFIEGRMTAALVLGVFGGLVLAFAGCFEFTRRDVT
jgi:lantibiotic transport system permease protein